MKKPCNLFLTIIFLSAFVSCNWGGLPTPAVSITHVPNAETVLRAYLDALLLEDYSSMYPLLTEDSHNSLSQEDFFQKYRDALNAMTVRTIEYTILSILTNPSDAQGIFNIIYHTSLLGDFQREITASLRIESGEWRIEWDDGLILPELQGGSHLAADCRVPTRGDIYDQNDLNITTQTDVYAIGLIVGQVNPDTSTALFNEIYKLTGVTPGTIQAQLDAYAGNPDWYIPVGEIPVDEPRYGALMSYDGVVSASYTSRYYFGSGIAPQSVGYTRFISEEDIDSYRRLGYCGSERVGDQGVEKWGEDYLHGTSGTTLYVVDASGNIVSQLASVEQQPAQSIVTTIDRDLQYQAQQAMDGLPGAIVVLERDTGRVLAMVSSPGFDQNFFDIDNPNNVALTNLLSSTTQPLLNRATQSTYPLGSVFKIITMAAALESGVFTQESTYDCQYEFTELGLDHIKYDWTYDHCLREMTTTGNTECTIGPSGELTLPEGLMRSCNPWFWHIGLELFDQGKGNLISDMAKSFGLGRATGIEQVAESEGQIPYPNPNDREAATNIAIGQGDVLVSPLQVAVFTAAVANGGTLYKPQLVERIQSIEGETTPTFQPEINGTLPITPENLKVIQDAMHAVTSNKRGTAYHRFYSLRVPVAGKTGTAETGIPDHPHAWFTGYTMANNPDKRDIVVTVLVENKGEGSEYAAPIFRRIVEIYYYGRPQSIYWFESAIGVTETPTPEGWTPEP